MFRTSNGKFFSNKKMFPKGNLDSKNDLADTQNMH